MRVPVAQRCLKSSDFAPHGEDADAVRVLRTVCRFQVNGAGRVWGVVSSKMFLDKHVEYLFELPRLASLTLSPFPSYDVGLTPTGVKSLAGHPTLRSFFAQGNRQIDDAAAKHVSRSRTIKYLLLPHCGLGDSSASYFAKMNALLGLSLIGNRITDDSVVHLCKLTALRRLFVNDTGITLDGTGRLRSSLTKCRIFAG